MQNSEKFIFQNIQRNLFEFSSIKWLDFDHVLFTLFLDVRNVLICFIYISSGSPSLKVGVGPVIQILMIDQRFRRRQSLEIITCIQSELSARTFSIWIDSSGPLASSQQSCFRWFKASVDHHQQQGIKGLQITFFLSSIPSKSTD